ncbi:uncharacterized protein LOC110990378 [Acanthaster planci]|uniref:Uncharacterized protein LOC110990378 n=1 Tax=Acanthaster planci TaxID=133434 RepID=A0A8B8A533_ACAPL|nr:uncharacterized protein LOC110990378 [Acanthaster planci]
MWSSYRKCTGCTGVCNVILGLTLVLLWASCYRWCLSRLDASNDLAAPLWLGILSVVVGAFGLVASCLYWKRKYETLLCTLTVPAALCSGAGLVLSVHAAFREYLLYESMGRPLESLTEALLGVVLFGVMAALSFALFLLTVTWGCTCFFKRVQGKRRTDEDYDIDDVDAMIWAYQTAVSSPQSSTDPRRVGPRRFYSTSSNLISENESEARPAASDNASNNTTGRGPRESPGTDPGKEEGEGVDAAAAASSSSPRLSPAGPRFASVTAAELRWWEYYTPPTEKNGFGGF